MTNKRTMPPRIKRVILLAASSSIFNRVFMDLPSPYYISIWKIQTHATECLHRTVNWANYKVQRGVTHQFFLRKKRRKKKDGHLSNSKYIYHLFVNFLIESSRDQPFRASHAKAHQSMFTNFRYPTTFAHPFHTLPSENRYKSTIVHHHFQQFYKKNF